MKGLALLLSTLLFYASASAVSAEGLKKPELPAKTIGHASRQLLIDGWDMRAVKRQFGAPRTIRKTNFMPSSHGHPIPPGLDEQWYYPMDMGHRLIAFKQGRVILAIEEWSDF
jgi:hypothetical protein